MDEWDNYTTGKKFSLWWKDSFNGESDDPRELIRRLIEELDSGWCEEVVTHYWGIHVGGLNGPLLFPHDSTGLADAVAHERESVERRRVAAEKRKTYVVEGFLGAPETMESGDFLSWWDKQKEERATERKEHPLTAVALDAYWAVLRFFRDTANPRDIAYRVKSNWQRMRQGFADSDSWDGDNYMLTVILGMLQVIQKSKGGVPFKLEEDYTPDNWRTTLLSDEAVAFEDDEWDAFVLSIITAFGRKLAVMTHYNYDRSMSREESDWVEAEFLKAGRDFFRYFNSWWI